MIFVLKFPSMLVCSNSFQRSLILLITKQIIMLPITFSWIITQQW